MEFPYIFNILRPGGAGFYWGHYTYEQLQVSTDIDTHRYITFLSICLSSRR